MNNKQKAEAIWKALDADSQMGVPKHKIGIIESILNAQPDKEGDERERLLKFYKWLQSQWVSVNAELAENCVDTYINQRNE